MCGDPQAPDATATVQSLPWSSRAILVLKEKDWSMELITRLVMIKWLRFPPWWPWLISDLRIGLAGGRAPLTPFTIHRMFSVACGLFEPAHIQQWMWPPMATHLKICIFFTAVHAREKQSDYRVSHAGGSLLAMYEVWTHIRTLSSLKDHFTEELLQFWSFFAADNKPQSYSG